MNPVRVKKDRSQLAAKSKVEFARIIAAYSRVASLLDTEEFSTIEAILKACGHNDFWINHESASLNFSVYQYKVKNYMSPDESIVRVKLAIESLDEAHAPERVKETINAESGYVQWVYEWDFEFAIPGAEAIIVPLKVDLSAYIDKGSDTCRRVQTGTKEVPIYSYDCSVPADVVDPATLPAPVVMLEGKI